MNLIDIIERFLECSVHTWLHSHQIYASSLFEQRRFMNVAVWQCRHPDVIAYIKRVFSNMRLLLHQVFWFQCFCVLMAFYFILLSLESC